jgi:methylamine--corrinoid protein Co-methyltransferase
MGSEGVAVTLVAYSIMGCVIHGALFNNHFPFHLNYGSNTTRELLWSIAMAGTALARNTKLLYTSNGFSNAGPMTAMVFRETAVHAMISTVCGWHLWEMASARNKYRNRATPLEARIGMEVGHAVARQMLTREQVNEIALKLLATYEDQAADAPLGSEYQECYDVAKAIPTPEHLDMFKRVKDEIASLGIEFAY